MLSAFVPAVALSAVMMLACGTESQGVDVIDDVSLNDLASDVGVDVGADAVEPVQVEQPTPAGRVIVASYSWGGEEQPDANISIDFFNGPMRMDAFAAYTPGLHKVVVREGDCVLYGATEAACDPVCDWDKFCDATNNCVVPPERISGGKVTVTAGSKSVSADPSNDEWMPYYYYVDPMTNVSLSPETTFSINVVGDVFPAMQMETVGPGAVQFSLNLADNSIDLEDGRDNEITWDPLGDGSLVRLVLNNGWHGAPPENVVYCEVPASKGKIVIAKAIVEALPSIGGPALMGHSSFIEVIRTVTAPVALGEGPDQEMEFTVSRRAGLNPTHNAEGW
jgi:hypothetical protein